MRREAEQKKTAIGAPGQWGGLISHREEYRMLGSPKLPNTLASCINLLRNIMSEQEDSQVRTTKDKDFMLCDCLKYFAQLRLQNIP